MPLNEHMTVNTPCTAEREERGRKREREREREKERERERDRERVVSMMRFECTSTDMPSTHHILKIHTHSQHSSADFYSVPTS